MDYQGGWHRGVATGQGVEIAGLIGENLPKGQRPTKFVLNNTHAIDFALRRCGLSRHDLQGFV
jgi:hypothetical protein